MVTVEHGHQQVGAVDMREPGPWAPSWRFSEPCCLLGRWRRGCGGDRQPHQHERGAQEGRRVHDHHHLVDGESVLLKSDRSDHRTGTDADVADHP